MDSPEMKKEFNVLIEKDADGFYVSTVPELPGCHTQAKSLDELMKRTKEVIGLCPKDCEIEKSDFTDMT
jgi:predicted RNase H-like HicB family nuclease